MAKYAVHICGPSDCPNDPAFEHDGYFGCIPKNFSPTTGRSRTHRQAKGADGRYHWNGGCDAATSDAEPSPASVANGPVTTVQSEECP